eukprot:m.77020 g.77020  ORF g.77020 m.77020 type:complete len:572 (-) comp11898_c0_seq2:340-2055(-)
MNNVVGAIVLPMDAYPIDDLLVDHHVLFVCSTTGDGDAPDNMLSLWRCLLRRSLPPTTLSSLNYSVFGLGDSSYPKFNFAAKRLNKRLGVLGGTEVVEMGLADDQHALGIEGAFRPWMDNVLRYFIEGVFANELKGKTPLSFLPPRYRLQLVDNDNDGNDSIKPSVRVHDNESPCKNTPACVPLKANTRLTPTTHFQDVRHVVLDISSSAITYTPGDVVYVLPENTEGSVNEVLDWFEGVDGTTCADSTLVGIECEWDASCSLPSSHFPKCLTWRQLLTHYLDIQATPRRRFFEIMAHFATDEQQKEKLEEFLTGEGQEALFDYCHRMRRTCVEVMKDFHSTCKNIPFSYAVDMFGFMQPRAFSIASSPSVHPGEIHATIAIVNYKTRMSSPRTGVFTSWLSSLPPQSTLSVWTQKGTLPLPSGDTPIICVGPGTGSAPFRSIINERASSGYFDNTFVFGNRNVDCDFFYKDEWKMLEEDGKVKLFTAFSRDQEEKIYVQHVIAENGAFFYEKLQNNAHILLSGNSKNMPKQVRAAFVNLLKTHGSMGEDDAEAFVSHMEKKKRYVSETWS